MSDPRTPPRRTSSASRMSEGYRILLVSVATLAVVSITAAGLAMGVLYRATFEQHRERLVRIVQHRSRILGAVAEFDTKLNKRGLWKSGEPTEVGQILEVYKSFSTFGETGEFTIARLEADQIVWLLSSRDREVTGLSSASLEPEWGQPMRRALQGSAGTMVGVDYRGEKVLAAFEPVPEIGVGIVAKIDLAEIREPFVRAGMLAAGIVLVVVSFGIALTLRLASPLVRRLEERVTERTTQLATANWSLRNEIREREQTEVQLRRMSNVFMGAAAPILIQDDSGRVIDLNAEAERSYGWTREELLGQSIDALVPPEFRLQHRQFARRCLRGERVRNVESWRLTKAGEWIPVLLTFSLLPDSHGGVGGVATIAKDLTQQKRLEEQLRMAAAEATVAEERERRKLALDLHDGVGQLLGLTSMKLGALRTAVADFGLGSKVREIERVVAEVQQRASSLVFQLSPPILHDVGLVAATHWLAEDMGKRFGLEVTVDDEGEAPRLDDTTRITLFRAVSELLTNVAKHAGTKEAHVHFGSRNGAIHITVEDQGIGFDPASRMSGFGLFSIGERLSHLGGSAHVDSAPGKGTTVLLTLPASSWDDEEERASP